MGANHLLTDRHRPDGHRAGLAGPALTRHHHGRPNASELRPPRPRDDRELITDVTMV